MNNNYQVLQEALDKATQKGAFNLQETGIITQALIKTGNDLRELDALRAENEARKEPQVPQEAPKAKK